MKALFVLLLVARVAHADCPGNAIVTLEDGVIVNAEWPAQKRAITNATLETTYTDDGELAAHAEGSKPASAKLTIPADGVLWSDKLPSSLERIVAKARAGAKTVKLVSTSKDVPTEARVEAIDATDFTITVGTRTYDVVTDDQGCLLAATLAPYGVTFERRDLAPDAYPLEGAYTAPKGAPYTATDVKITAPQGHTLAGTLTRPRRGTRVPAVVLITGISKHERNEGNPPFTPFRDIADVLGRAGIAVLRVDDRGVGASTGDFDKATSFDEADDVRTELAWLKKQPGIDPKRVGVVGHSEGGLIALVVGATDPSLAAIGVLAGSGVPG
ncbi:MAG: alpha/beta hydrolase, partial [Deltaproteobacteria bacterium]|nr:alpha/beta hydrolase [Deltaproteobacteria bacterium]